MAPNWSLTVMIWQTGAGLLFLAARRGKKKTEECHESKGRSIFHPTKVPFPAISRNTLKMVICNNRQFGSSRPSAALRVIASLRHQEGRRNASLPTEIDSADKIGPRSQSILEVNRHDLGLHKDIPLHKRAGSRQNINLPVRYIRNIRNEVDEVGRGIGIDLRVAEGPSSFTSRIGE